MFDWIVRGIQENTKNGALRSIVGSTRLFVITGSGVAKLIDGDDDGDNNDAAVT